MVIGIQTNNRLPLPGKGDPTGAPGRSSSASTQAAASDPEPVVIQPSAPAASQPAIVQLNFSGARALSRAHLAGDRTASDPNIFSQSTPAPSVQPEAPSAAGAGALQISASLRLKRFLSPNLLDATFIRATTDLAASLLTGSAARPARIVPLAEDAEKPEKPEKN